MGGLVQLVSFKYRHELILQGTLLLTLQAYWPGLREIPRPVIQASHVPRLLISVHLKIQVLRGAAVTTVTKKLHGFSIPL